MHLLRILRVLWLLTLQLVLLHEQVIVLGHLWLYHEVICHCSTCRRVRRVDPHVVSCTHIMARSQTQVFGVAPSKMVHSLATALLSVAVLLDKLVEQVCCLRRVAVLRLLRRNVAAWLLLDVVSLNEVRLGHGL